MGGICWLEWVELGGKKIVVEFVCVAQGGEFTAILQGVDGCS